MEKIIVIFEDGTIRVVESVTEDDFQSVRDGLLTIINPRTLSCYDGEKWLPIPEM